MIKPAIRHLLEITIIKRFLFFLLFASASIFASEIELLGPRVFISGEGDIELVGEVLRKGYQIDGRLLRPAMVIVHSE